MRRGLRALSMRCTPKQVKYWLAYSRAAGSVDLQFRMVRSTSEQGRCSRAALRLPLQLWRSDCDNGPDSRRPFLDLNELRSAVMGLLGSMEQRRHLVSVPPTPSGGLAHF